MVLEQDKGAAIVACGSVEAMLHFFIAFESTCRVEILADTPAAAYGTAIRFGVFPNQSESCPTYIQPGLPNSIHTIVFYALNFMQYNK
jgi:hypothetical protein